MLVLNYLMALVFGVLGGILFGSIPGLTATMGVALLMPLAFYLDVIPGFALLFGIYVGGVYGGSISAILVGVPGTPAATATLLDGFPMAKQGYAGKAIGIATIASFVGGMVSWVLLFSLSKQIARLSLNFGTPEYFALALTGLAICSSITETTRLKGLISGALGVLLSFVGTEGLSGQLRFTYGIFELYNGIPYIPAMIGLFGLAEILNQLRSRDLKKHLRQVKNILPSLPELKKLLPIAIRGGLIGSLIGTIPGAGGNIAAFLSYDLTQRLSPDEEYGKGNPKGVIATESGNNGVTGGALIPLLTFGIPGDSVTAVLMGALLMFGLQPGWNLFTENIETTRLLFWTFGLANIFLLIFGLLLAKGYAKIITLPKYILLPLILFLCIVGSFAIRNTVFDIYVMIAFGVFGYFFKKAGFSAIPLVLGLILGNMAEVNFRRTMILAENDLTVFGQRATTLVLLLIALITFLLPFMQRIRDCRKAMISKKN